MTYHEVVLPHLGAARRLARWLVRNPEDAEDAVQDASMRALRYFDSFDGKNGRAWFLTIVRNACNSRYRPDPFGFTDSFDEEAHSSEPDDKDPETMLVRADERLAIRSAIAGLPDRAKRLITLREIEGLSYRELSDTLGLPMGTVMSGLARARAALRSEFAKSAAATAPRE